MKQPRHSGRSLVQLRGVGLGLAVGLLVGWWLYGDSPAPSPDAAALEADFLGADEDAEAPGHDADWDAGTAVGLAPMGPQLPPSFIAVAGSSGAQASAAKQPRSGVISGRLQRGESLTGALRRYGIRERTVVMMTRALKPHFDFRHSRPGDQYTVHLDDEGQVVEFFYTNRPDEPLRVSWDGTQYVAKLEKPVIVLNQERVEGVIVSNLYDAIHYEGHDPQLANSFQELFAREIDFHHVHRGDRFSALYERRYHVDPDGTSNYMGLGRVLAAYYKGAGGEFTAVYFKAKGKPSGYYRADGSSLEGEFLWKPVEMGQISSDYRNTRRHPILKVTRPHHGIDWAAARGTPVWAVASGKITFRRYAGKRGFGNLVKIEHDKGYVSYYGHLQSFAGGLKEGDRVQQKQIIGYVGATGLATGPHVCFRIKKNGRYVNPRKVESPAGDRIAQEDMKDFRSKRDDLLNRLNADQLAASASKTAT